MRLGVIKIIRKIVNIDEDKCNGCGQCAQACHEGAIEMRDGKAHLIKDDFCDGFGDCLPECPTGAISITEREAADYDKAAVETRMNEKIKNAREENKTQHVCPGKMARAINRAENNLNFKAQSELTQWPVQIKLAPVKAPFYENAKLLIASDCTAYAYAAFHQDFIRGRVTLIGCPKLDDIDYSEKLCGIIKENNIKSVVIVRMEVPCCGGLENAAKRALQASGKFIPWRVVIISTDGRIIDE